MIERDRRALLIGGGVAIAAWLLLRGLPAMQAEWHENRERVIAQRLLLMETRRAIEGLPQMEDSAKVLTRRVAGLAPRILTGSSRAIAMSDFSSRLSSMVTLAHGRVLRFEETPDSVAAGPLHRITAQLEFETDFRGVGEVLDYLGRGQPAMVAERLQVTAADPAAPPTVPEQLNVVLWVSAWYLAQEGEG